MIFPADSPRYTLINLVESAAIRFRLPEFIHNPRYGNQNAKPGAYYQNRVSDEVKEILKGLKSDDLKNIRIDTIIWGMDISGDYNT